MATTKTKAASKAAKSDRTRIIAKMTDTGIATLTDARDIAEAKRQNRWPVKATGKAARKAKRQHTLATHLERNGAHAYAERVPIMRDELADNGGAATVKELFKALKTSPTGLFATERRVAATFRFDQRQDAPIFERNAGMIVLRKRQRVAAGSKRNGKSGAVSRKRTRKAA